MTLKKSTPNAANETTAKRRWRRTARVGDTIFVGGQLPVDATGSTVGRGNIEVQTARVFDSLVDSLKSEGAQMADLMKLHTYYQYSGSGRAVTDYWERMTQVRLKYLANPGPAATALRVAGSPGPDQLIQVDGIALLNKDRRRLMPKHAWDWSIPTPFSQGWRIGNKLYVGGQISADRQGKAVAAGDVREQTRNTMEFIRHVLLEGGATWQDLVTLKICFKSSGAGGQDREFLAPIIDEVRRILPAPGPALTAFGVDLLYEGLVLEIDGFAVLGEKTPVTPAGSQGWVSHAGFTHAWRSGNEIYIGGLSAPGGAGLAAQAEATLERTQQVLATAGADLEDLVKATVFIAPEQDGAAPQRDLDAVEEILNAYLPTPGPVITVVSVSALAHQGQQFQLDGIAVRGQGS